MEGRLIPRLTLRPQVTDRLRPTQVPAAILRPLIPGSIRPPILPLTLRRPGRLMPGLRILTLTPEPLTRREPPKLRPRPRRPAGVKRLSWGLAPR